MKTFEQLIDRWRDSLADLPETRRAELEDHLRQLAGEFQSKGLSASEALAAASVRLGRPSEIVEEAFNADPLSAVAGWLGWMAAGSLLYLAGSIAIEFFDHRMFWRVFTTAITAREAMALRFASQGLLLVIVAALIAAVCMMPRSFRRIVSDWALRARTILLLVLIIMVLKYVSGQWNTEASLHIRPLSEDAGVSPPFEGWFVADVYARQFALVLIPTFLCLGSVLMRKRAGIRVRMIE